MSAPTTGAGQHERLLQAGHRGGLLPQLTDVDTIDTAAEVSAQIPHSGFARALQAALAQRGAATTEAAGGIRESRAAFMEKL
ncbi:hypothetical protein [Arthrobacter sp. UYEF3]|uniref:hypothetical protein n=1 Tax=Arthrobacter sp. UYEF3 TaxID=1756365 RepID=UPI0033943E86